MAMVKCDECGGTGDGLNTTKCLVCKGEGKISKTKAWLRSPDKPASITAADSLKVAELVKTTLAATIAENKTMCFVDLASFFGAGKFSHMRKHNFVEAVSDELTDRGLNQYFGSWVFTEYGDGYYVFVKLVDSLKDGFILYPTNRTKFESLSQLQFANEVDSE